jgi:malonyl-CoA/methylmalonyl-CoA synthetase
MSTGYYDALAWSLDKYRDRSAIFSDDGRSISYRGLADDAGRMAACLAAMSARPGDRIAAQVERSPEALALFLACLRAGLVYVPINPALTPAEVEYYLADAGPRILVVDPARERVHAAPHVLTLDAAGGGTLIEAARSRPSDSPAHAAGADDVALLLYTSGTTGRPKGAMLTHGNLASNVRTLCERWRFTRDDVLLHALPLSHVHGLVVALGCAWLSGCTTRLLARFDPAQVTRELATATVFMGVPTHYTRLLAEPALGRDACRSMRLFVSGSAPLTAGTFAEFERRTGHRILERYGMTETLMIASNPYDGERVAGSVGFPLPDVEVRVVDADGRPVATDAAGVLEVRGPNVCRGYWRAPEKTTAAFRHEGWFITGDVGRIDGEGRVWLEGRASDLIISGGYNVYPREIEDALLALDGVTDAAVFGVPHPQWGESVVAALCARTPTIDEARVIGALREQLAGYKLPKRIVVLDALPRNAMGKVQKQELRATYARLFVPPSPP